MKSCLRGVFAPQIFKVVSPRRRDRRRVPQERHVQILDEGKVDGIGQRRSLVHDCVSSRRLCAFWYQYAMKSSGLPSAPSPTPNITARRAAASELDALPTEQRLKLFEKFIATSNRLWLSLRDRNRSEFFGVVAALYLFMKALTRKLSGSASRASPPMFVFVCRPEI